MQDATNNAQRRCQLSGCFGAPASMVRIMQVLRPMKICLCNSLKWYAWVLCADAMSRLYMCTSNRLIFGCCTLMMYNRLLDDNYFTNISKTAFIRNISCSKNTPNALWWPGSALTHRGRLTHSHRPPSHDRAGVGIKGARKKKGEERKKEREGRKRRGRRTGEVAYPHLQQFSKVGTCDAQQALNQSHLSLPKPLTSDHLVSNDTNNYTTLS